MSAVVLIEVNGRDALIAQYGSESYRVLHQEFTERLKVWVRAQDQLVVEKSGRVCALLKGLKSSGQINLAANKLNQIMEPAYEQFGATINLDVHAGFTLTDDDDTRESALARAGSALAQAQRDNRPYQLFDTQAVEKEVDEYKLVSELKRAVEMGEFTLFFQPKVNAAYRNVVGAEALIRWMYKDNVLVTPDAFIAVAERHEQLIKPITFWAVKSAIARCARWGGNTSVAVNVPPNLLEDDELLFVVQDTLELQNLAPQLLTLEVTESVMAGEQTAMFEQLSRLRALGVRVSLDDFGTGYSSMAYFRDIPADELKIDRSFVSPMLTSERDHAIVKTVIDLARNFSLKVVAEGWRLKKRPRSC